MNSSKVLSSIKFFIFIVSESKLGLVLCAGEGICLIKLLLLPLSDSDRSLSGKTFLMEDVLEGVK
jgi:hypothetical protein